jgi:PTS system mannose-specific IIC component
VTFEIAGLALLGAILALDTVSFPQIMVSRPIVSATLAGTCVGRPAAGLLIGAMLELVALETLPFGASRYPEWGSSGVVGGSVYALQPGTFTGALVVGMVAALATALLSSWSMVWLRTANARVARAMRAAVDGGSAKAVNAVQVRCMLLDLLRGGLVTAIGLIVFAPLSRTVAVYWDHLRYAREVGIAMAAMVAVTATWKLFRPTPRAGWLFLGGLIAGWIIIMVL